MAKLSVPSEAGSPNAEDDDDDEDDDEVDDEEIEARRLAACGLKSDRRES